LKKKLILNTAPVESAGTAEITQPLKQEKSSTHTGWNVVFQKYKNMPKLVHSQFGSTLEIVF
jgi:hypothetical protein